MSLPNIQNDKKTNEFAIDDLLNVLKEEINKYLFHDKSNQIKFNNADVINDEKIQIIIDDETNNKKNNISINADANKKALELSKYRSDPMILLLESISENATNINETLDKFYIEIKSHTKILKGILNNTRMGGRGRIT